MRKDSVQMPMSGAGIFGGSSDTGSRFQLRPSHVIVLTVALVIVVSVLHLAFA